MATAVNILDRYLSTCSVEREDFMLVALVAIFDAAKFQETAHCTVQQIAGLGKSTPEEVLAKELHVLDKLSYRVHVPTSFTLVHHFLALLEATIREGEMAVPQDTLVHLLEYAVFYCEVSYSEYSFVGRKPSTVALASFVLASHRAGLAVPVLDRLLADLRNIQGGAFKVEQEVQDCIHELASRGADFNNDYDSEVANASRGLATMLSKAFEDESREGSPTSIARPFALEEGGLRRFSGAREAAHGLVDARRRALSAGDERAGTPVAGLRGTMVSLNNSIPDLKALCAEDEACSPPEALVGRKRSFTWYEGSEKRPCM